TAATQVYTLSLHDALPIWRVRAVMRELNYHPNAVARSLVRRRTQTIGVALSRSAEAALANPFFPEVLRGIGKKRIGQGGLRGARSEEHTSELQSRENLVCR